MRIGTTLWSIDADGVTLNEGGRFVTFTCIWRGSVRMVYVSFRLFGKWRYFMRVWNRR